MKEYYCIHCETYEIWIEEVPDNEQIEVSCPCCEEISTVDKSLMRDNHTRDKNYYIERF